MDQGDYLKYFDFSVLTCQSDSSLQTFIYLKFIYLFLAALGLRCCAQAFSICSERGYSLVEGCRLLSPCWASSLDRLSLVGTSRVNPLVTVLGLFIGVVSLAVEHGL